MTPELMQLSVAIVGWLAAFLLGKELATGYGWWRARRRNEDERRRP
jgi:hypothetical protein